MSKLFTKDPQEVVDYTIDWSDFTDAVGSPQDVISSSTWTMPDTSPQELVQDSNSFLNDSATIFVSAGLTGEVYVVKNQIVTTQGRTHERVIYIHIVDSSSGAFTASLIVEDGSVIAGANAYDTRENVDRFHARRNATSWFAATAPQRDAAIIKATSYLVEKYRNNWKGIRTDLDQTLDWPRAGVQLEDYFEPQTQPRNLLFSGLAFVLADDVIPQEVKDATAVLALPALTADLNPTLERGGDIKRVKAGSVEVEYGINAPVTVIYKQADDLLRPLLKPRGMMQRG